MKQLVSLGAALLLAFPTVTGLQASESAFLQQFSGNWTGEGEVRMTPDSSPVGVSCEFDGQSAESSAVLDGTCTGMILFTRQLGAHFEVENNVYIGSYVGSPRGTATLEGSRDGSALNLTMQWPGHPPASMTLESTQEGRMVLTTVEPHPETGQPVLTAELELQRQ